jgi:hypothetical protein
MGTAKQVSSDDNWRGDAGGVPLKRGGGDQSGLIVPPQGSGNEPIVYIINHHLLTKKHAQLMQDACALAQSPMFSLLGAQHSTLSPVSAFLLEYSRCTTCTHVVSSCQSQYPWPPPILQDFESFNWVITG